MSKKKQPKWAIRDLDHGKTFFFDSYEEMVAFMLSSNKKENEQLLEQIEKGAN